MNFFSELFQQTEWHRVVVFRPSLRDLAIRYITKGKRILIQGRLSYVERKDVGNESYTVKSASIIAEDITLFR